MKIIKFLSAGLIILIVLSCEKSVELDFPKAPSRIIVDGWIEQGRPPKVLLTRSLPYFSEVDSSSFRNLLISKAKVSVTVDGTTEILTLHHNDKYFPPFIYQGFQIEGEVGKTYTLNVEINKKTITAKTRIPEPPTIDSLCTITHPEKDTLKQIMVQFTDDPNSADFYRMFSRIQGLDQYYKPSYASVFSDDAFNGSTVSFPLFKGYTTQENKEDLYFSDDDTVYVKFCTISRNAYQFWKNYQSEQMNSLNPFASSAQEIEGNVNGDGKGVWTGYGVEYDKIIIP